MYVYKLDVYIYMNEMRTLVCLFARFRVSPMQVTPLSRSSLIYMSRSNFEPASCLAPQRTFNGALCAYVIRLSSFQYSKRRKSYSKLAQVPEQSEFSHSAYLVAAAHFQTRVD